MSQAYAKYWMEKITCLPFDPSTRSVDEGRVRILVGGKEISASLISLIQSAQNTLSFQFLNIEADSGGMPVAHALMEAAGRGVKVRGVLDEVTLTLQTNGEFTFWPMKLGRRKPFVEEKQRTRKLFETLRREGVELNISLPNVRNHFTRNHRKSVVADNSVLWIGGFNPTEHNMEWHDVAALVEGELAVEAQKVFNRLIVETGLPSFELTGEVKRPTFLTDGVSARMGLATHEPRTGPSIRKFFALLSERARSSIRFENAYFSDPSTIRALAAAARRGIQVQLIVPGRSNHPFVDRQRDKQMRVLLDSGVEVFRYRGMTHAKVFTIDDALVSIGSSNFTRFNLAVEREMNLVAVDPAGRLGAEMLERVFLPDIANSVRVASQSAPFQG